MQKCIGRTVLVSDGDGIAIGGRKDQVGIFIRRWRGRYAIGGLNRDITQRNCKGLVEGRSTAVGHTNRDGVRWLGFKVEQATVGNSDQSGITVDREGTRHRLRRD